MIDECNRYIINILWIKIATSKKYVCGFAYIDAKNVVPRLAFAPLNTVYAVLPLIFTEGKKRSGLSFKPDPADIFLKG
nr:MAG: hypothetical protein DIU81_01725 [[Clostridium] cellulosi]